MLPPTGTTGSAADFFPLFNNTNDPQFGGGQNISLPSLVDSGDFNLHTNARPVIDQMGNGE
ncbi:hypothetical protein [Gimesia sp.]|uniref:hypothetical protein n=1 Tax=Gimesia sp. TaxID=2024833 RepID=UPI003A95422A